MKAIDHEQSGGDYQNDWDFYLSNVDNKPGSLFIDLGLCPVAPIKDKPNVAWISVMMNYPSEDGLSSSEESNRLYEIEDNLVPGLLSDLNAVYVGRLTSDGRRDFYFYLADTTAYDKVVAAIMLSYPDYNFNYGTKPDEEWSGYLDFLYPSPEQLQCIWNRRVVDQLREQGDTLTKAREVHHWAFFKTAEDRSRFLQTIETEGFDILDEGYVEPADDFPFRLHIKRTDLVDQESVDSYVLLLWKQATACNGYYDGWETIAEAAQ